MTLRETFEATMGGTPDGAWVAPGRVNLIGEHTDYNDGFVLPLALPQGAVATAAARTDRLLRMASLQAEGLVEISVDDLEPGKVEGWAAYVAGVVWAVRTAGHDVGGLDILIDGDVPLGAGLSSSAALECATALAVADLHGLDIERPALARLAQQAENDFVGMPCGIMDQSAALLCTRDHALFLDTRSLGTEQVPLELGAEGLALLVVDTKAPHRLVDGEYAARRRTCEEAAAALGLPALRDLDEAAGQDAPRSTRRSPTSGRRGPATSPPRRHRERPGARDGDPAAGGFGPRHRRRCSRPRTSRSGSTTR